MQQDERIPNPTMMLRRAFRGFMADVWTALPATVTKYDATKRTVELQPAIQAQVRNEQGAWSNVNLPVLINCPVLTLGAGDYLITVPIQVGDEGLVVFSSRAIDAFWQSGGTQPQVESRMHDLSDGIFLPGALSQVQDIPDVDPDKIQIRSKDGTQYIELGPLGGKMKGNFEVDGNLNVTGEITFPNGVIGGGGAIMQVTGAIAATGDITAKSDTVPVTLGGHHHGGVQSGGSNTSGPVG